MHVHSQYSAQTQISGRPFQVPLARYYVSIAMLYSFLETLDRHLKTRVSMMDKFLIKRLVLERILYSELWAVESFRSRELEFQIINDISTTLHFFTFTIPAIASNCFAICKCRCLLFDKVLAPLVGVVVVVFAHCPFRSFLQYVSAVTETKDLYDRRRQIPFRCNLRSFGAHPLS